ncbi:MAG: hypothetical protein K5793_03425 [Nitrosarchaeum sp.]|nr:hypothetical protein [Nitrosarchaeum sp.]
MQFNLGIESFNVNNTSKENLDFKKYDIDVSLNEIENSGNSCTLKYGFTFSSSPKGIRLTLEGTITINGSPMEFENLYQKDEQNMPNILRQSYHELYPVLFMIAKSMNIPCPPYEISKTMDTSSEKIESQGEIHDSKSDTNSNASDKEETSIYDSMSTEELTKMQIDLNKEYSETPSEELKSKLDAITDILNRKIKESVISPQNVS